MKPVIDENCLNISVFLFVCKLQHFSTGVFFSTSWLFLFKKNQELFKQDPPYKFVSIECTALVDNQYKYLGENASQS